MRGMKQIMEDKKVSIIIPAYNVENYIEDCLESILNQTYTNIEVIIVNDGSTDGTLEKITPYADKDKRIIILNQENQGVSATRNNGIEIAKGEYFAFFDADDYIPQNAIELFVKESKETDAEIVVSNFIRIKNGKILGKLKETKKVLDNQKALEELFN